MKVLPLYWVQGARARQCARARSHTLALGKMRIEPRPTLSPIVVWCWFILGVGGGGHLIYLRQAWLASGVRFALLFFLLQARSQASAGPPDDPDPKMDRRPQGRKRSIGPFWGA